MSRRSPDPRHPLPNRVTPFGDLVSTPARGTMFGNRGGRFHDAETRTLSSRRWASKAWLICDLHRDGVRRDVWGTTGYTELFFLDEVTALAAGHRPCAFCRRPAFHAYLAACGRIDAGGSALTAPSLDARLHAERLDGREKRRHRARANELPEGAVILLDDRPCAIRRDRLLAWSNRGWSEDGPIGGNFVEVLTPPTSLAALSGGYRPRWHRTASDP